MEFMTKHIKALIRVSVLLEEIKTKLKQKEDKEFIKKLI